MLKIVQQKEKELNKDATTKKILVVQKGGLLLATIFDDEYGYYD